jgi:hypothetical protein
MTGMVYLCKKGSPSLTPAVFEKPTANNENPGPALGSKNDQSFDLVVS